MVFKFTILINILLASGILAQDPTITYSMPTPQPMPFRAQPIYYVTSPQSASDVVYSTNWGGAVRSGSEGTFTNITGTLTVPPVSQLTLNTSAVALVGIDGNTCQQAVLQTGIYISVDPDGKTWCVAWYEWYPDFAMFFTAITINPGDEIKASVAAYNKTSGRAVIENLTTGQTATQELSSSHPLCLQDVEWVVENFEQDALWVPFGNFDRIEFTNAVATDSGGKSYGLDGATLIDLNINSSVLTSVGVSGDKLTILYV